MKLNHLSFLFLSFNIVLSTTFLVGCGEREVNSKWRDREITVNGIDTEWKGARLFLDKEKVTIGLLNDESYLYVRLSSRDRKMQAQMIGLGLTVWFDPKGGRKKAFGIHFPLGRQTNGTQIMRRDGKGDSDQFQRMLEESQSELELLGHSEDESCTMLVSDVEELGINVKIDMSKGNLVYELKVPLTQNELHPFAIATDTTKTVGIGFETGKIDMEQLRKMIGERSGRIGGMRSGGGRRGGIGRVPGGIRPGGGRIPEHLELWVKTKLASAPSVK